MEKKLPRISLENSLLVASRKLCALALLGTLGAALTACGDADVDAVKAAKVPGDATHTYDTALSNRESCDKEKWTRIDDDDGRKVIEYRCSLKGGVELVAAMREHKIRETKEEYARYFEGFERVLQEERAGPDSMERRLVEAKQNLARVQDEQDQEDAAMPVDPTLAMRRDANRAQFGKVAAAKSLVERLQAELDDAPQRLTRAEASYQTSKVRYTKTEAAGLDSIEKNYGDVTKASEVITWFVTDGQVMPRWAGAELEKKDDTVVRLNRNWDFLMRDVRHSRGAEHVRYVLDAGSVKVGAVPGPSAPQSGEACFETKLKVFRKEMGEQAHVNSDVVNEWRGECGLPPA